MTNQQGALQYADRDHTDLGSYYMRHVSAMTGEALHSKSAIAAELAHRDREIDRLQDENANLNAGYAAGMGDPLVTAAPQQEAQEPVAWYVTGCGRLLDEDEAKAEARHIGGTARAIPLYTAPQADSVTAPAGAGVAHALSDGQIEAMPVWRNFVGLWPESRREIVDAVVDLLTTPPAQAADSVLEDAARWQMAVLVGNEVMLPPDKRSNPAAVKAYMGAVHSGLDLTGAIDAARKQGANHD